MKQLNLPNFLASKPIKIDSVVNQYVQVVDFYEHPEYGEECPVLAVIDDKIFETEFWDTGDFFIDSDYNPILIGEVCLCFFETVN